LLWLCISTVFFKQLLWEELVLVCLPLPLIDCISGYAIVTWTDPATTAPSLPITSHYELSATMDRSFPMDDVDRLSGLPQK